MSRSVSSVSLTAGPGTGLHPAEIEDVRALRSEPEAVRNGLLEAEVDAAVVEGVGRAVDDAHHFRALDHSELTTGTFVAVVTR